MRVTESATLRAQPATVSLVETSEASLSSSAEHEFLHPLKEVKALEESASCCSIKGYETGEYDGCLQTKKTFLANAASAARSSKQQACCCTKEWSGGYVLG